MDHSSTRPKSRSPLLKRQMPGLDTLRGIAVLAVVFYHGLAQDLPRHLALAPLAQRVATVCQGGWLGVNLFFVLSGFLITGILLDTRQRGNYWSSFYTRRALRIFPLYLVVLVLAHFVLGLRPLYLLLCLLYAANLDIFFTTLGASYGPLWSLAVEEQFYLLWPLLIRRLSSRALTFICLALIVLSPLLRGLAMARLPWLGSVYSSTWLISDNLAWGALIALFLRSRYATARRTPLLTLALGSFGIAALGVAVNLHLTSRTTPGGAAFQAVPFLALFTTLLLLALRFGDHPAILRLTAPIRFYGYISYGLYLLHILCFNAYDALVLSRAPLPDTLPAALVFTRFAVVLATSTVACYLSRRLFEDRFLSLKDRLTPRSRPVLNPPHPAKAAANRVA